MAERSVSLLAHPQALSPSAVSLWPLSPSRGSAPQRLRKEAGHAHGNGYHRTTALRGYLTRCPRGMNRRRKIPIGPNCEEELVPTIGLMTVLTMCVHLCATLVARASRPALAGGVCKAGRVRAALGVRSRVRSCGTSAS